MPCARDMAGLEPVARMPQPSSVPKNQYSTPITTAVTMNDHDDGVVQGELLDPAQGDEQAYLST